MNPTDYAHCADILGNARLRGLDTPRVCIRLRTALRAGEVRAIGYRQAYEDLFDEATQRSTQAPPPTFQLTQIPSDYWRKMPRLIDGDATGTWCDEVPDRWHKANFRAWANWFEGSFRWWGLADGFEWRWFWENYSAVRIHRREAEAAIARLAGTPPPRRPGRPPGRSKYSAEAALYVEGADRVQRDGEALRSAATALEHRAVPGATFDSIVKRLERGIAAELKRRG